jgi:hypothetical protein
LRFHIVYGPLAFRVGFAMSAGDLLAKDAQEPEKDGSECFARHTMNGKASGNFG